MPSQKHESRIFIFRNQPALAAELLRDVLGLSLPSHSEVQIFSADLSEVQPVEYRADLVLLLCDNGEPVFGIIVEVQLQEHERKKFTWPAYVVTLRAQLERPVILLVMAPDDVVARWAAEPIDLGGGSGYVTPHVIGPSDIPEVLDEEQARANPELAVLSAMAHGRDDDPERAARIALIAQKVSRDLDERRSKMYFDLITLSLSEAACEVLKTMDMQAYEYQSEFARRYVAEGRMEGIEHGRTEGERAGRVALLTRLLVARFGPTAASVRERVQQASIEELEAIGERLLSAATLQEAVG